MSTDSTEDGTEGGGFDVNVRRVIGPDWSLVAAVMAERVAGASSSVEDGSAITRVELRRRLVRGRRREDSGVRMGRSMVFVFFCLCWQTSSLLWFVMSYEGSCSEKSVNR